MKMENEKLIFGSVLKTIRESRGMSLRGVASILGTSATYVVDLEKNARKVTLSVVKRMKSNFVLTEEEEKMVMNAFTHDRLNIPVELLYYLIDNDLLDSMKLIQKEDKSGESIKHLALTLGQKNAER